MSVDEILQELQGMDLGVGAMAFMSYVLSLRGEPRLELTTDGFMICFGRDNGIYVYKVDVTVHCRMTHEEQSEDFLIAETAKADALFKRVVVKLIEEIAA